MSKTYRIYLKREPLEQVGGLDHRDPKVPRVQEELGVSLDFKESLENEEVGEHRVSLDPLEQVENG